ncbi:hypothetical protein BH11ARM2_BH11ARM2_21090 [soil metagenome]
MILIIPVDCLSCGLKSTENVKAAFAETDALNVVAASSQDEYRALQKTVPGARVEYVEAGELGEYIPAFGPRVFGFDRRRKLAYLQAASIDDIKEEVKHAREAIRR